MTTHEHLEVSGVTEGDATVLYHRDRAPEILLTKKPITLPSGLSYEAHTLKTGGDARSVVIVATRGDELLLVQSYRPSLGALIWELPRGFGEGDPLDARQAERDGRRELLEETGYEAASATVAGEFVLDTTFYPTRLAVVRCEVTAAEPTGDTDGEVETHAWVALADLPRLKRDGVIHDGASLAALAIAQL